MEAKDKRKYVGLYLTQADHTKLKQAASTLGSGSSGAIRFMIRHFRRAYAWLQNPNNS
jgi:hypothetical protein